MRSPGFALAIAYIPVSLLAQNTTGSISGMVKSPAGEALAGATVMITHEPTGSVYRVQSSRSGRYEANNLDPGGPYSVEASFVNFANGKKNDIHLNLGDVYKLDLVLQPLSSNLGNVLVTGFKKNTETPARGGIETTIGRDKMANLPSVGRNIYDYLKAVPLVRLTGGNEAAVSIAGQNNRYNAFYVDGAINNDVFGLAASGTNGGQTGISPVSIDAIDQFQVVAAPYDAAQGHFIGGSIHAITKGGSNRTEGSVYYFLQNQDLAGRTPTGPKELATRLNNFSKKNYGFRTGGAFIKNKLFYFINADLQRNIHPQPFDFSSYTGNTKDVYGINGLAAILKSSYGYDPGAFPDNPGKVNADRIAMRIDWNIGSRHKLTISNRWASGQRYHTNSSSASVINFYNNGYLLFTRSQSVSAELKSLAGRNAANKLLITYTDVLDDRNPLGQDFPRVRIHDGAGAFVFGADNQSTVNLLMQKNWTLFDEYRFAAGSHRLKVGADLAYSKLFNAFIQNSFGSYTYASVHAFLTNQAPSAYTYGFSQVDDGMRDNTQAVAKFKYASAALFLQDEYRINDQLVLNLGLRADLAGFLNNPAADAYANQIAIPQFSRYWDLKGAASGAKPSMPVSFSPRFGWVYQIAKSTITVRGGFGFFTGRIPLVWPGGIYNNNGIYIGGYTANIGQLARIRFRPDPAGQWKPGEVGAGNPKGTLNLVSADFRLPRVFKTSLAIEKKFENDWSVTMESYFTKNINEICYTNTNLMPPIGNAVGPDKRAVYTIVNNGKIPLNADGSNPYENVILLSNNTGQTGYSYGFAGSMRKSTRSGFQAEAHYSFGNSFTTNDGTSSVNLNQWRFMETVNGRNPITRSVSDFSGGHRIFVYLARKWEYAKKNLSTTLTLTYTGQSGSPLSYVYGSGSMTRDDGISGGNDLIYIPSPAELAGMIFLPNTILVNGTVVTYTAQEQKEALEAYISRDPYLRKHRGAYAERNGDRLPFTHIIDCKITQDFIIRTGRQRYRFRLSYDIFNLGNLLNRNWGRQYFQDNDQFSLVSFAGYVSATDYTPQYRFNPAITAPFSVSNSTHAPYAARWISQLGIRLIF